MALRVRFEREIGKDAAEPRRHPAEVVGVAEAAESEVDRPPEAPQTLEIEVAFVEGADECREPGRALGHPGRRRTFRRRRRFDALLELIAGEAGHEFRRREAPQGPKGL